jgi:hypothetical protein
MESCQMKVEEYMYGDKIEKANWDWVILEMSIQSLFWKILKEQSRVYKLRKINVIF